MKEGSPARTTVVATVGPACRGADVLSRLIEAGVGVLRLNLSHGELGEHLELLEIIRSTEERLGWSSYGQRGFGNAKDHPGRSSEIPEVSYSDSWDVWVAQEAITFSSLRALFS